MAVAGRFMTKWLIVWGIVMVVGGGMGCEGGAFRERFGWIVMVLFLVAVSCRRSSAACWMKVCPSSQNGWTNFSTFEYNISFILG